MTTKISPTMMLHLGETELVSQGLVKRGRETSPICHGGRDSEVSLGRSSGIRRIEGPV